jgi:hypothetical protein
VALFAVVLTASASASAQTRKEADRAAALFRAGQGLLEARKVHEACEQFDASLRLDFALGTLLNLADCHQQEGKTATALAEFRRAEALAARKGRADRERFAREQAAELEKSVAYLQVSVPPNKQATGLSIDDREVPRGAWGEPLATDPGVHRVVLQVAGGAPEERTVDVAPGSHTVVVSFASAPAVASPPPAPPEARPRPSTKTPSAPEAVAGLGSSRRTVGFVLLGVGAVATAVGAGFGLATLRKKTASEEHCTPDNRCAPEGLRLQDEAFATATAATIGFAVGALAAASGLVVLVTAPRARAAGAPNARSVRVSPTMLGVGLSIGSVW